MVITINGRSLFWYEREISYEQVINEVYTREPSRRPANPEHTVTFFYRSERKGGTLTPGQKTSVEEMMVISAMMTDLG